VPVVPAYFVWLSLEQETVAVAEIVNGCSFEGLGFILFWQKSL
jgi:hypothetical protein